MNKKQTASFFILISLCLMSLYILKDLEFSTAQETKYEFFEIEFDYFGMDGRQIEKTIALALEERLSSMERLHSIKVSASYSRCTASLAFHKGKASAYPALCSLCNEYYRTLPSDVQPPRIRSSSQSQKYIFCAAFDKDRFSKDEIEQKLKARILSVPGVSDVTVSGGGRKEIQLSFNQNALSFYKIRPEELASAVQQNLGHWASADGILYRNELKSTAALGKILVKGVPLSALADISYAPQKEEEKIRINGKEAVALSVRAADEGRDIFITSEVRKRILENFSADEWNAIYDKGMEQKKMAAKILAAFVQSVLSLALIIFILEKSFRPALLLLAFTALDLLFSLALLTAAGLRIDGATVSGFTISLGLICDNALFVMELKKRARTTTEFSRKMKSSLSAMLIATLTTVSVTIPLAKCESFVPGIKKLSISASIMILISLFLSVLFLPNFAAFSISGKTNKSVGKERFLPRIILKLYDFLDNYVMKNHTVIAKMLILAVPALLTFASFAFSGKNLSQEENLTIIPAQIEYNPEKSFLAIDREILPFCDEILKIRGVDFVQSECRRGVCILDIVLKKASDYAAVSKAVLACQNRSGAALSGFLYIPLRPQKRKSVQEMLITVTGASHGQCRKIAAGAAAILRQDSLILQKGQVVLNFKDDERIFSLCPDKERLLRSVSAPGSDTESAAHFFRANVFGPVVKKVIFGGMETDVRIGNKDIAFRRGASLQDAIPLLNAGGAFRISEEKSPSKLYRENGLPCAQFSVRVEADKSERLFSLVKERLGGIQLSEGYSLHFPEEFEGLSENYRAVFISFVLTVAALFLLIAAQCENAKDALKVVWTVPLSLLLPFFLRLASRHPLRPGDMTALVLLSGLCINNAVFILNEFNLGKRRNAAKALENVLQSILTSSLTTIAGAVPMMLLAEGFSSDLAFFMLWGTAGSVFSAAAFPALLTCSRLRCEGLSGSE